MQELVFHRVQSLAYREEKLLIGYGNAQCLPQMNYALSKRTSSSEECLAHAESLECLIRVLSGKGITITPSDMITTLAAPQVHLKESVLRTPATQDELFDFIAAMYAQQTQTQKVK